MRDLRRTTVQDRAPVRLRVRTFYKVRKWLNKRFYFKFQRIKSVNY